MHTHIHTLILCQLMVLSLRLYLTQWNQQQQLPFRYYVLFWNAIAIYSSVSRNSFSNIFIFIYSLQSPVVCVSLCEKNSQRMRVCEQITWENNLIVLFSIGILAANSGLYAHYVFNTLDSDRSGIVSFEVSSLLKKIGEKFLVSFAAGKELQCVSESDKSAFVSFGNYEWNRQSTWRISSSETHLMYGGCEGVCVCETMYGVARKTFSVKWNGMNAALWMW